MTSTISSGVPESPGTAIQAEYAKPRPPAGAFPVVFSDLDGTLLDAAYSFAPAKKALELLAAKGVPVVLCTSKTREEVEAIRGRMGNADPFIVENGGAVYVPVGYFPARCWPRAEPPAEGPYRVVRLGTDYATLRDAVVRLREQGFALRGFGDMTDAQVAALTGQDLLSAGLARRREFDETLVHDGPPEALEGASRAAHSMGLRLTQARFWHLSGAADKGRAARVVGRLFRAREKRAWTVALGDGRNDEGMLRWADAAVAVARPDGGHEPALTAIPGVHLTRAPGPAGWAEAIEGMFGERKENNQTWT